MLFSNLGFFMWCKLCSAAAAVCGLCPAPTLECSTCLLQGHWILPEDLASKREGARPLQPSHLWHCDTFCNMSHCQELCMAFTASKEMLQGLENPFIYSVTLFHSACPRCGFVVGFCTDISGSVSVCSSKTWEMELGELQQLLQLFSLTWEHRVTI